MLPPRVITIANLKKEVAVRSLVGSARGYLAAAVICVAGLTTPVFAQAVAAPQTQPSAPVLAVPEAVWQEVIAQQVEAFRHHDAPGAFGLAGAVFRVNFPDAEAFYNAIMAAGYEPIMKSRSHSFGEFARLSDKVVAQVVHFVGSDNLLYDALYRMEQEPDGWRVEAVAVAQRPGVAI
jgi:hypothetical protein